MTRALFILFVFPWGWLESAGFYGSSTGNLTTDSFFSLFKIWFLRNENEFQKNFWKEMERVAKSEIAPNWHVFIFIFDQEIKEKVEKTVPWWVSYKKNMRSS